MADEAQRRDEERLARIARRKQRLATVDDDALDTQPAVSAADPVNQEDQFDGGGGAGRRRPPAHVAPRGSGDEPLSRTWGAQAASSDQRGSAGGTGQRPSPEGLQETREDEEWGEEEENDELMAKADPLHPGGNPWANRWFL